MEQMIQLQLPVGAVNLVLAALSELPFKQVAGLCVEIKRQADQQVAPPPERALELVKDQP